MSAKLVQSIEPELPSNVWYTKFNLIDTRDQDFYIHFCDICCCHSRLKSLHLIVRLFTLPGPFLNCNILYGLCNQFSVEMLAGTHST